MVNKMNRMEMKLYNIQLAVLGQKCWQTMLERVDFGKQLKPYQPVPIVVSSRLRRSEACASKDRIEVQKSLVKRATRRQLVQVLKHEMVHVLLGQNDLPDGHSALFKTCCHFLHLNDASVKEAYWRYAYECPVCKRRWRSMKKWKKIGHICLNNDFRIIATRQEIARQREAGADISMFIPITIKRIKPRWKVKSNGEDGVADIARQEDDSEMESESA